MALTPLLSVGGVEGNRENSLFNNSNDKQLTFRNKPIKWTVHDTYKTELVESVFSTEPEPQERFTGRKHLIEYEGEEYTREQFLRAMYQAKGNK